jgi:hypothetical protein
MSERSKHYSLPPRASSRPQRNTLASPEAHVSSMDSVVSSADSPFQMMDIVVSVDIMEGLVMELKDKHMQNETYQSSSKSHQQMSGLPVTTFVSCKKNVSRTRTISTHVPSLPLSKPSSSHGGKHHHFLVRWPADFDPYGDALSTFKLSRLMKKESSGPNHNSPFGFGYIPEEIELTIGLVRGSEMLTLGLANLVITGEETEEMIIDLPINITKEAVKDTKSRRRSPSPLRKLRSPTKSSIKVLKPAAFPSDPKRKYRLSDQSMIRLQVKITPKSENLSTYEDSEVASQEMDSTEYGTAEEYMDRMKQHSDYTQSSDRAAPMDELQDDFHSQARIDESDQGRIFGKEIPRLTQDYICGQIDYGRSVDNAYDIGKTTSYDPRRVVESSSRDYYHNETPTSYEYGNSVVRKNSMIQHSERSYINQNFRPRAISRPRADSRPRAISRPRADSRPRSDSRPRAENYSRTDIHPRADSRPRSGSRTRSDSRLRSMPSHSHPSMQQTRSSSHFSHPKPKVRDENRHPVGVKNWFLENVVGQVQGAPQTKIVKPNEEKFNYSPQTRPNQKIRHTPPLPRNFSNAKHGMVDRYESSDSCSYDSEEYYEDEEYYDENQMHNERPPPTRRISSMR